MDRAIRVALAPATRCDRAAPPRGCQSFQIHALEGQQLCLYRRAASGILPEMTIASDHPMTRDQPRDRVLGQCRPNRTRGPLRADRLCNPSVRAHLADGDGPNLLQHPPLERCETRQINSAGKSSSPRQSVQYLFGHLFRKATIRYGWDAEHPCARPLKATAIRPEGGIADSFTTIRNIEPSERRRNRCVSKRRRHTVTMRDIVAAFQQRGRLTAPPLPA